MSDRVKPDPVPDQFSTITRPYTRLNGLKTIPFPAAHTRIANIWEYPLGALIKYFMLDELSDLDDFRPIYYHIVYRKNVDMTHLKLNRAKIRIFFKIHFLVDFMYYFCLYHKSKLLLYITIVSNN